MKKNKSGEIFLIATTAIMFFFTGVMAQSITSYQEKYQSKMSEYRSDYSQFERDKQLYGRRQTEENLEILIKSANKAYIARQAVMVDYNYYLMSLLQAYSKNKDVNNQLNKRMTSEIEALGNMQLDFQTVPVWNKLDADFSSIMAVINETAYQAFAQIYWHELQSVVEEFTTLYQNQNQRILDEAINKVDREQKARVLERTLRSLQSLQQKMGTTQEKLKTINGRESYVAFRNELNLILAEAETNLKLYANLE